MLFLSMTYAVTTSTEVVVDNKTKLEWQNEAVNKTETKSWQAAIDYCEGLTLDGKEDWRLPNVNELKSLVDYSKSKPAIVSTLKETTKNANYWSSTAYFNDTQNVFYVNFSICFSSNKSKSSENLYVRCVRDSQ